MKKFLVVLFTLTSLSGASQVMVDKYVTEGGTFIIKQNSLNQKGSVTVIEDTKSTIFKSSLITYTQVDSCTVVQASFLDTVGDSKWDIAVTRVTASCDEVYNYLVIVDRQDRSLALEIYKHESLTRQELREVNNQANKHRKTKIKL